MLGLVSESGQECEWCVHVGESTLHRQSAMAAAHEAQRTMEGECWRERDRGRERVCLSVSVCVYACAVCTCTSHTMVHGGCVVQAYHTWGRGLGTVSPTSDVVTRARACMQPR